MPRALEAEGQVGFGAGWPNAERTGAWVLLQGSGFAELPHIHARSLNCHGGIRVLFSEGLDCFGIGASVSYRAPELLCQPRAPLLQFGRRLPWCLGDPAWCLGLLSSSMQLPACCRGWNRCPQPQKGWPRAVPSPSAPRWPCSAQGRAEHHRSCVGTGFLYSFVQQLS